MGGGHGKRTNNRGEHPGMLNRCPEGAADWRMAVRTRLVHIWTTPALQHGWRSSEVIPQCWGASEIVPQCWRLSEVAPKCWRASEVIPQCWRAPEVVPQCRMPSEGTSEQCRRCRGSVHVRNLVDIPDKMDLDKHIRLTRMQWQSVDSLKALIFL